MHSGTVSLLQHEFLSFFSCISKMAYLKIFGDAAVVVFVWVFFFLPLQVN